MLFLRFFLPALSVCALPAQSAPGYWRRSSAPVFLRTGKIDVALASLFRLEQPRMVPCFRSYYLFGHRRKIVPIIHEPVRLRIFGFAKKVGPHFSHLPFCNPNNLFCRDSLQLRGMPLQNLLERRLASRVEQRFVQTAWRNLIPQRRIWQGTLQLETELHRPFNTSPDHQCFRASGIAVAYFGFQGLLYSASLLFLFSCTGFVVLIGGLSCAGCTNVPHGLFDINPKLVFGNNVVFVQLSKVL